MPAEQISVLVVEHPRTISDEDLVELLAVQSDNVELRCVAWPPVADVNPHLKCGFLDGRKSLHHLEMLPTDPDWIVYLLYESVKS